MTFNLNTEFPDNTKPADANLPFGGGRNITLPGDNTGTPFDEKWFNDWNAFFQSLLTNVGEVPNDTQDSVLASQLFDAFTSIVNGPAIVKTPVNVSPAPSATVAATSPTLIGNDYQSLYERDHKNSRFRIATDSAMTAIVYDSGLIGPVTQHTIVTPIAANATYFFDIRYTDEDDINSDFSTSTTFDIPSVLVQTPTNLTPLDGDLTIGEQVTVTSSTFSSVPVSVHDASQWQISTDQTFVSVDFDSGTDLVNLLSFTQAGLTIGETQYFWRVRHRSDTQGFSAYSTPTSFTTVAESVEIPTNLLPLNSSIGVGPSIQLTASVFATVPVAGQTHVASQWQVATDLAFTSIVFDSGTDAVNLESITATGLIEGTTQHFWRVRYQGSTTGFSDFSEPFNFTTLQQFADWSLWDGAVDGLINQTDAFNNSATNQPGRSTADVGNGRFIVVSMNSGNSRVTAKLQATSGLVIAVGSEELVPDGASEIHPSVIRLEDGKALVSYRNSSFRTVHHVITVSGTDLLFGGAFTTADNISGANSWDVAAIDSGHAMYVFNVGGSDVSAAVLIISGTSVSQGTKLDMTSIGDFSDYGGVDVIGTKAIFAHDVAASGFKITVLDIDTGANTVAVAAQNTDDNQPNTLANNRFNPKWVTDSLFIITNINNGAEPMLMLLGSYDGASTIGVVSQSAFRPELVVNGDAGIAVQVLSPTEIIFAYMDSLNSDFVARYASISGGFIFYGAPVILDGGTITTTGISTVDIKKIDDSRMLVTWDGTTDNNGIRQQVLNGEVQP